MIRDLDFRRRTYYFIDGNFRRDFSQRDENGNRVAAEDSVRSIQVFVSGQLTPTDEPKLVLANAYPDPPVYDAEGMLIQGSEEGDS